jgi:hypothetical protein
MLSNINPSAVLSLESENRSSLIPLVQCDIPQILSPPAETTYPSISLKWHHLLQHSRNWAQYGRTPLLSEISLPKSQTGP